MSRLSCTFCAHRNPEGSRFCNQCGSPLHLVPCAQCDAINNASDTHCYACGAPLHEPASEELVAAGFMEGEQGGTGALVYDRPSPVRLADHLEDIPWDLPTRARATAPEERASELEEPASPAAVVQGPEPVSVYDDTLASAYARGRAYRPHSSRWGKRIVLGCALLAIAGAVAWSTLRIPFPWQLVRPPAPTAAPPRATSPSVPTLPRAPVTETAPVSAPVPAPVPERTAAPAPEAVAEPPPAQVAPSKDTNPAPAAATKAQPANDPRRRSEAVTRTREQALRDAAATQRLIERQLADVPRTDQGPAPTARR